MKFNADKVINDARALGIEVNENSDNPGIYYLDDNGERVKWDYESEFRELFGEENRGQII